MSRPKPSGRSCGRLTRHERNTVERMLDRNRSAREIAAELGRSPSTVTREVAALSSLRGVLGEDGARRAFGAVLADNGSEFADEGAIAALFGERDGETRLFYCDPRQSQQKGACEKNHVEIRKLLPKGAGARFDRLTAADCALLMSQVNSEPRGALGFLAPARVLRAALGEDASALMDAYGIEELAPASTASPPAETGRRPGAGGYFRVALAAETRDPLRLLR